MNFSTPPDRISNSDYQQTAPAPQQLSPPKEENVIVQSVKSSEFSPAHYLASFVQRDIIHTKEETELDANSKLDRRFEPIHPHHNKAPPHSKCAPTGVT